MIVVVGSPFCVPADPESPSRAIGVGPDIARAAVARGAAVQLVGKVGDDPAGDATLIALVRDGVGHAAVLRDPTHVTPIATPIEGNDDAFVDDEPRSGRHTAARPLSLEPEDLELALRYLSTFAVLVVAEPIGPASMKVATEAATYVGAALVVLVSDGAAVPDLPRETIVLGAPLADADGVFAATVGAFAAALDAGVAPAEALRAVTAAAGWEPATA